MLEHNWSPINKNIKVSSFKSSENIQKRKGRPDRSVSNNKFLAHLSRRLKGELIVYQSSCRLCVCQYTFSNLNISATSWPIVTKFYLYHHWGGGKAALGFGPGQIGSELWCPWQRIFFILAGNENTHNISEEFDIRLDRTKDCGISCP